MNMEEKVPLDFFFINHEPDSRPTNYSVYLLLTDVNQIESFECRTYQHLNYFVMFLGFIKWIQKLQIPNFSFWCSFSSIALIHKRNRLSYIFRLLTVFQLSHCSMRTTLIPGIEAWKSSLPGRWKVPGGTELMKNMFDIEIMQSLILQEINKIWLKNEVPVKIARMYDPDMLVLVNWHKL